MNWMWGVRETEMLRMALRFWSQQWEEWSCYLLRCGIWKSLVVFHKIKCVRLLTQTGGKTWQGVWTGAEIESWDGELESEYCPRTQTGRKGTWHGQGLWYAGGPSPCPKPWSPPGMIDYKCSFYKELWYPFSHSTLRRALQCGDCSYAREQRLENNLRKVVIHAFI